MLSHLKHYAEISSGAITIDAPSLTRFAIDNLHSHSRACFIAAQPKLAYQSAVALFFRTRSGFAIRSFQLSPILISHRLLDHGFSFDYLSVDARFYCRTGAWQIAGRVAESDLEPGRGDGRGRYRHRVRTRHESL
jgi:hypothetical protein